MQFGVGLPDGPLQLVTHARALAARFPHHVFLALDITNAFGAVRRKAVRAANAKHLPGLVPLLYQQWAAGPHRLLQQVGPAEWEASLVGDGLFQGLSESSSAFC
eukprot:7861876-Lingulodinium_polyedra.AAC.1